jgi:hypothetical protein
MSEKITSLSMNEVLYECKKSIASVLPANNQFDLDTYLCVMAKLQQSGLLNSRNSIYITIILYL